MNADKADLKIPMKKRKISEIWNKTYLSRVPHGGSCHRSSRRHGPSWSQWGPRGPSRRGHHSRLHDFPRGRHHRKRGGWTPTPHWLQGREICKVIKIGITIEHYFLNNVSNGPPFSDKHKFKRLKTASTIRIIVFFSNFRTHSIALALLQIP